MDERKFKKNDPWDEEIYGTGNTRPPKNHGGIIALLFIVIYFLCRRVINFQTAMDCIPKGFIAMVPAIIILVFAWTLGGVTRGMLEEFGPKRVRNTSISETAIVGTALGAAVTGLLLSLTCTPSLPYWMLVVGNFFAIVVVKQMFGGIGQNFVNPALAARIILINGDCALRNVYCNNHSSVKTE